MLVVQTEEEEEGQGHSRHKIMGLCASIVAGIEEFGWKVTETLMIKKKEEKSNAKDLPHKIRS